VRGEAVGRKKKQSPEAFWSLFIDPSALPKEPIFVMLIDCSLGK
jgi:hypothetical protein